MTEDILIVIAIALFVAIPIILGEVLDFIFKVSWSIIKRIGQ